MEAKPVAHIAEAESVQTPSAFSSHFDVQAELARYKPIVREAIEQDAPYQNACGHSDQENAVIEGNAAVRRAILKSGDMELIKLFSDESEFRIRLCREVIDETYPRLHELLRPLSQDDIDDAIRAWNGDMGSKRAVVRYMKVHGWEEDTAAWLAREYGGSESDRPLLVRAGSPESVELPWPDVQRRIVQLIQADDFFTEQEQDDLEDIDPIAIREELARYGIVNGEIVDEAAASSNPFIQRVMADVERIAREEAQSEEIEPPEEAAWEAAASPDEESPYVYAVGDTVYLDDKPFEIAEIGLFDVQLRDPSLTYPIFRAESKETFHHLLEQDERNAAHYPTLIHRTVAEPNRIDEPEPPPSTPEPAPKTVAYYPAEKNHLPYDVVIQTISTTSEPKKEPPRNFRIVDDNLGHGGPKAKFRANMDAIHTLQTIEQEQRTATPEEQEILPAM